jgi:hypothetical protein
MTLVNLETGEIVDKDATEKPSLETLVERGVNVKREQSTLKDDLAVIASQAKQLYGVSKRDFNAIVKYSCEKSVDEDIEELQAIRAKLQNLGSDSEQVELFGDDDAPPSWDD